MPFRIALETIRIDADRRIALLPSRIHERALRGCRFRVHFFSLEFVRERFCRIGAVERLRDIRNTCEPREMCRPEDRALEIDGCPLVRMDGTSRVAHTYS